VTARFMPSINASPLGTLPEGMVSTIMVMGPVPCGGQAGGRARHLPLSYGAWSKNVSRMAFDTCWI